MRTYTTVSVSGIIGGAIWMPSAVCSKNFSASNDEYPFTHYSDGSKATLRDIVLHITNDGDFQGASIADATVEFNRVTVRPSGEKLTRTRTMDIRKFPSVADCVLEHESDEYWEVINSWEMSSD